MRSLTMLAALSLLACGPADPNLLPEGSREECGVGETCSCDVSGAWLVRAGGVLLVNAVCLVECVQDGENRAPCELVLGGGGTLADASCDGVDCVVRSSEGGCAELDVADGPACLDGCRGAQLCAEDAVCTVSTDAGRCDCACP